MPKKPMKTMDVFGVGDPGRTPGIVLFQCFRYVLDSLAPLMVSRGYETYCLKKPVSLASADILTLRIGSFGGNNTIQECV